MNQNNPADADVFPEAFCDLLASNARDYGEKLAIVYGTARLTWADLDREISVFANSLLNLYSGSECKGSRLAIIMENRPEFLIAQYGAQRAGLVSAPISTRFIGSEIRHVFNNCNPIGVVTSHHFFNQITDAFLEETDCPVVIIVGKNTNTRSYVKSWDVFMAGSSEISPNIPISSTDVGIQLFTGGTTGLPKGTDFTHQALMEVCNLIPEHALDLIDAGKIPEETLLPTKHEIKFLVPTPLYHLSGFMPALLMTAMKRTVVFPTSLSFSPEEVCDIIEKERITTVFMVPTQFRMFLDYPELEKRDLSSVTLLTSGGAKMPAEMKKEILTRFPNVTLVDGYGQTENIGAAIYSFMTVKDIPKITDGYIGKPISGVKMMIINERGEDVVPGEVGEAVYQSPSLMQGYHDDDSMTGAAYDGTWFRTGDLFKMDEEGNYYYVDRKSEVIVSGGEKVFPAEVEGIIYQNPKVQVVAVVGEPDRVWGEKVTAYIQPKEGVRLTSEEITEWCEGKMASYKKPRTIVIKKTIPIAEDGKILRSVLKKK